MHVPIRLKEHTIIDRKIPPKSKSNLVSKFQKFPNMDITSKFMVNSINPMRIPLTSYRNWWFFTPFAAASPLAPHQRHEALLAQAEGQAPQADPVTARGVVGGDTSCPQWRHVQKVWQNSKSIKSEGFIVVLWWFRFWFVGFSHGFEWC